MSASNLALHLIFLLTLLTTLLLVGCEASISSGSAKLQRIDIVASPVVTRGTTSLKLAVGNSQPFIAIGHYEDDSSANLTNSVSWHASTDKVTVAQNGLVTAIDVGMANVTASAEGITSNSVSIEVTSADMTSVVVTPSAMTLAKDQAQQLTATAIYSDGTTVDITDSASWSSVDPATASVTATGLITGVDEGATQVISSKEGLTSNDFDVNVTAATMTAIQISTPSATFAKGQSQQLTAIASYSDGSKADVTEVVNWQIMDPAIASVTPSGLLTGNDIGSTMVTASKDALSSNDLAVVVTNAVMTAIQISPVSVIVAKGQTEQLSATATYSDGHTANVTDSVAWLPADPSIVTVSPDGLLTGTELGSTLISVSQNGIASNNADAAVTDAVITALTLTVPPAIAKGQIQQLTAIAAYSDGSTADITDSVAWFTTDPAIATVTPAGALTGVAVGSTSVSANKGDVSSDSANIDVKAWATIAEVGDFLLPSKSERAQDATTYSWDRANAFCENSNIGGGGWHLPAIDDLVALYNAHPDSQLHDLFGWPTHDEGYWSATENGNHPFPEYDYIFLSNGMVVPAPYSNHKYVTCVRSSVKH